MNVSLSKLETATLSAWKGCNVEFGYLSFDHIAERSGVERHRIRRIVRALARKDMLQFSRGLWSDDGEMRGSGYGLTDAGRAILSEKMA